MPTQTITTIPPSTRAAIRRALALWYADHQRTLPWRQTRDPYAIWVSEAMLQQTQVKTAIPYYQRFMAQFPNAMALARSKQQTVLKAWEGLGYYSRARNLHRAARMVADHMDGQIPSDWEGIRRLPGIGDYMASAILSIAYGLSYAVVDGNVKRVVSRLFGVDSAVNASAAHKIFQRLAQQLLDVKAPAHHNQGMMELGALVCIPRKPLCTDCPVARYCYAHNNQVVPQYPRKLKRSPVEERRMVTGVIKKRRKYLLVRRPDAGLLGGMWEFPATPLTNGGSPTQVLTQYVRDTTGLTVSVQHSITDIRHAYSHFKIHLMAYHCLWRTGRVRLQDHAAFHWVAPSRLVDLPIHGAMQKIIPSLEA